MWTQGRRGRRTSYRRRGQSRFWTELEERVAGRGRPAAVVATDAAKEAGGALLAGLLMGLLLCVVLPLVVCLLLYVVQYPLLGLSAFGAVGLGCWGWTERRRWRGWWSAQGFLVAQERAEPREAGRETGNDEQSVTRAWMEAMARDGTDVRLQQMAQAWLEGERDVRDVREVRAERARRARAQARA